MEIVENGVPRRYRLDLNTPAELAIRNAIMEVEKVGCGEELTGIVIGLDDQLHKLADYIEKQND